MIGNQSRHRNSTFSNGAATKKFDRKLIRTRRVDGTRRSKFCRKFISIGSTSAHSGIALQTLFPMRRSLHLGPSMSTRFQFVQMQWYNGNPHTTPTNFLANWTILRNKYVGIFNNMWALCLNCAKYNQIIKLILPFFSSIPLFKSFKSFHVAKYEQLCSQCHSW